MNFQYLVVELSGLPHPTYPHCLCVPKEWISNEVSTRESQRVAIPLPNEEFETTLYYIQTGGPPKPNWGLYLADTVMAARDFETARFAAETMINTGSERTLKKNKKTSEKKHERRRTKSVSKNPSEKNAKKYAYELFYNNMWWTGEELKKQRVQRDLRYQNRTKTNGKNNLNKSSPKSVEKANNPKLYYSFKHKNKQYNSAIVLKKLSKDLKLLHVKYTKMRDLIASLASVCEVARTKMSKAIPLFKERIASIDDTKDSNNESKSDPLEAFNYPDNTDKTRKWTLRHEEFKKMPGLVELLPNSGIYVRKDKLEKCIKEFKDSSQFAISLIFAVFSDKALPICEKVPIEKVLDLYALTVVNLYANKFCVENQQPIYNIVVED